MYGMVLLHLTRGLLQKNLGDFRVTVEKLVNSWIGVASGLKWVHRLDYATSGVLCVGLNTKFAYVYLNFSAVFVTTF
jgi:23S rRNA-/tRNA-specific pseudouridylate synthase